MDADHKHGLSGLVVAGMLAFAWWWGLVIAPTELHMGEVYRIIYLHVPAAFAAFGSSLALAIVGIWIFIKRRENSLILAQATAEVGLLFTVLTLATGSIWGRPTWGTWWTWDARLTTTFLLGILYAGWLILHASLQPGPARQKVCAGLGIMIFADVPVIYQSVNWWRTLHQPQSIMRSGGSTMDPEMLQALGISLVATLVVAVWLTVQRYVNLKLASAIERASYQQI